MYYTVWLSTNEAVHLSAKNRVQGAAAQRRPILIHTVMTALSHTLFQNL
jgi:hypothetical protein